MRIFCCRLIGGIQTFLFRRFRMTFLLLSPKQSNVVSKLNQDILSERDVVLYLNYKFQNEKLDDVDLKMIDDFALKYDVFTREKGQKRV